MNIDVGRKDLLEKKGLKILEQEKSQKVSLEKWEELGPRVQEPALSKARTLSLS